LSVVLDASALLALFFSETGSDRVARALLNPPARMSVINWAEVVERVARSRRNDSVAMSDRLLHEVHPAVLLEAVRPEESAVIAGLLVEGRRHGLGIADCTCLALGQRLGLPVLTADGAWSRIAYHGTIEPIR
jgi:ribonuclease VapC